MRAESPLAGGSDTVSRRSAPALVIAVLILVTSAAYVQVRDHEFVDFDDNLYVTDNPHVREGLSGPGTLWALSAIVAGNWHPLTLLSHMLDCSLFGLDAGGHHLASVLLHVVDAVVLFLLLRRMTGNLWPGAFVAALFALHPLHVESVAWISERKDVLSTLMWLVTTWAYVSFVRRPTAGRYAAVGLSLAVGLMAKPMLVTLPLTLLLLDYWPLGRFPASAVDAPRAIVHLLAEKAPLLGLAVVSGVTTLAVQRASAAVAPLAGLPIGSRIANALVSYATYLGQTLWPSGLAFFYPYRESLPAWQVAVSAVLLLGVTSAVLRWAKRAPYLAVGWLWYVGTLLPVIGFVQVGQQAHADRYTYVPLIGMFVMIAWGGSALLARRPRWRPAAAVAAAVLLGASAIATWRQASFWKDSGALGERAIAVTVDNDRAHEIAGLYHSRHGRLEAAERHFAEAVRIRPDSHNASYNLARTLYRQGRITDAAWAYAETARRWPDDAEASNGLANCLFRMGKLEEAAAGYEHALRLDPGLAAAHNNLGAVRVAQGRLDDAIEHYREALRLDPGHVQARYQLERILAKGDGTPVSPGDPHEEVP